MAFCGKEEKNSDERSLAFELLITEFQRRIYFFIRSMVFNPEDAKDVLQDVNMIIFRKRAQFALGTDFKSWAFAIARFECLKYLSRLKQEKKGQIHEDIFAELADRAESRADEIEPSFEALQLCLQALPDEQSSLLALRYDQKISLKTIAMQRETSVGALKQKLFRVRAALKKCIFQRIGKPFVTSRKT